MKVSEIMTAPVITVLASASLADLLDVLKGRGVSGVPVVDADDRLVGIVSRQDIILEELRTIKGAPSPQTSLEQILNGGFVTVNAEGLQSHSKPVHAIMTPVEKVLTCRKDTPLTEACALMADNRIHRLPVLNGRRLVGILTTTDVVRAVARGRL
jgi:CBS domain-containing protein